MTQVPSRSWTDTPELAPKGKKAVPEGLWIRCPQCAAMLFRKSVENNLWVCPECRYHFRISARQRIKQLTDPGSFEPFNERMTPVDPLNFVDLRPYTERLAKAQKATGENDGVQTGSAFIKGRKVILAGMDFPFLGGSMGSVVGEKITRAILEAGDRDLPIVIVAASGGARMMESGFSLMQMAKTAAALARFLAGLSAVTIGGGGETAAMVRETGLAEQFDHISTGGGAFLRYLERRELPGIAALRDV